MIKFLWTPNLKKLQEIDMDPLECLIIVMELPFLFVKGQHLRSGTPIIDNYAIVFNMFPIYRILGSTTSKNQKIIIRPPLSYTFVSLTLNTFLQKKLLLAARYWRNGQMAPILTVDFLLATLQNRPTSTCASTFCCLGLIPCVLSLTSLDLHGSTRPWKLLISMCSILTVIVCSRTWFIVTVAAGNWWTWRNWLLSYDTTSTFLIFTIQSNTSES